MHNEQQWCHATAAGGTSALWAALLAAFPAMTARRTEATGAELARRAVWFGERSTAASGDERGSAPAEGSAGSIGLAAIDAWATAVL